MKFVHKVQRVHTLFLLVTLFHSWLFSLLSHLFPVSDRFRNTIVIPPPPPSLPARSFNAPILPFVIYATGHRIRPPTLFSTSAWKGGERSLASPPLLVDYSAVSKHRFGLFIEQSRRFFSNSRALVVSGGCFDQRFLYSMFFFLSLPFFPLPLLRLPSRGIFHATFFFFFYFLLTFGSRRAGVTKFFIVPHIKFCYDFKPYE